MDIICIEDDAEIHFQNAFSTIIYEEFSFSVVIHKAVITYVGDTLMYAYVPRISI